MPPKVTASEEEIKKLYDPNYFYNHGENPALKRFMEMAVENSREGKVLDYRMHILDTYKKVFYARNIDDFLQRDCKAFTFTRAFAMWIIITMGQIIAGKWTRKMIPVGSHGITRISQTQLYHLYGPLGATATLGFYACSSYFWYKTTLFTAKKFYDHVLLGERQWMWEYQRQQPGNGEYFFSDVPQSSEESFPEIAQGEMAKKSWPVPEWTKKK